jgi:hypothetical protein
MMREIDSDPDHHRLVRPLEQDAGKLGAFAQEIVRPFDRDAPARRIGGDEFMQGNRSDERKRRRRRIAGPKANKRAGVEIALG